MISFVHSFQSEWIKTRRSLASWIVIIGAFFTPLIIIIARLVHAGDLPKLYSHTLFWNSLWRTSWESMAIFLLPMGVILTTSLITQLEYKNNTWKQLHTLPVSLTTIYFSKFILVLVMLAQFFILFNIGIYLSAVIPWFFVKGVPYPAGEIPFSHFLQEDIYYFIDCLPIVALQFLISLKYRNFLVSIGAGILLWVGAISGLRWEYGYLLPYTYDMYYYLQGQDKMKAVQPPVDIHTMATIYCLMFVVIGYVLYVTKRDKG